MCVACHFAKFVGKVTTFCNKINKYLYTLIVKILIFLQFVKLNIISLFILLTLCAKNESFRYKSSEPKKIPPLPC